MVYGTDSFWRQDILTAEAGHIVLLGGDSDHTLRLMGAQRRGAGGWTMERAGADGP